jgi:biofilm PGA synthesis N-glycosyltransferase PgaC
VTGTKLVFWFLLAFVALYPIVTSGRWIAGGLIFRLFDERNTGKEPEDGWPGVTILIPAYNEESVIRGSIQAAREVDYPEVEVLVLDDGSTDATADRASEAAAGDPRVRTVRDPENVGKGDRLNLGFRDARHDLVLVTDADTHLHPGALRLLVSRLLRHRSIGAVAGAPHVTNRQNMLTSMQTIEAASTIGLIRRTEALSGRVGTVAGVLGLFRREAVLGAGGYNGFMSTEDIDLSWRLLIGGWGTTFEPAALVGMQVPANLSALWAQRKRWARGQGEVLRVNGKEVMRWRNRRLWPLVLESTSSLFWVVAAFAALILALLERFTPADIPLLGFALAWGIAIGSIAMLQVTAGLVLDAHYDRGSRRAMFIGPFYPIFYWLIGAGAALTAGTTAFVKGPRSKRVVWDIPREEVEADSGGHRLE